MNENGTCIDENGMSHLFSFIDALEFHMKKKKQIDSINYWIKQIVQLLSPVAIYLYDENPYFSRWYFFLDGQQFAPRRRINQRAGIHSS